MRHYLFIIFSVIIFCGGPGNTQSLNRPSNIDRVSTSTEGVEGNGTSQFPTMNNDGRFIAFQSWASNLVTNDTNKTWDVFVHDRLTGETKRVSVGSHGEQGNGRSESATISADGRFIGFSSNSSNIGQAVNNYKADIYIHDLHTGETTCVSITADGKSSNGASTNPSLSADGRYVAFTSTAYNLIPNTENFSTPDVFVHDRKTKQIVRASVSSEGKDSNDASSDASIRTNGKYIAFASAASNLVPDDTNNKVDIFVHDLLNHQTTRVSVASDGTEANGNSGRPRLSLDGRYIVFTSEASNLVPGDTNNAWDIFVHDLQTHETTRVSLDSNGREANGDSTRPRISTADGRYIVFASKASNLVPNDTNETWDIFVHDRKTGETRRVSIAYDGKEANAASDFPAISNDGKYIAFDSWASNLVPNDTNNTKDIFVVDNPLMPPAPLVP